MLNVSISPAKTVVENTELESQWTIDTAHFFGDVFAVLVKNFPDFKCSQMSSRIITHVTNGVHGLSGERTVTIFGIPEIGVSLYNLQNYIDGKKVLCPDLREIEILRINNRMTANYLPVSIEQNDTMRFKNLTTVTQVMVAFLYYCAYHELKLVPCKHCGKWFVAKNLKSEYCNRISPCYNMVISGRKVLNSPLSCERAVRTIVQKFRDREKCIYNNWYVNSNGDYNALINQCNEFKDNIKANPTPENIARFQRYLYSDTMPKQERPNRRKSITRGLLGS